MGVCYIVLFIRMFEIIFNKKKFFPKKYANLQKKLLIILN